MNINYSNSDYSIFKKFKDLNKSLFVKKKYKTKKKFLIEFNAFHDLHAIYSILTHYMNIKKNINVDAFFNYSLHSAPLNFNTLSEIKWTLGKIFNLGFFGIYRSFNVQNIFKPNIKRHHREFAKKFLDKNFYKLKSRKDLLKVKVENILIGDLIYDTYIKSKNIPTIDINTNNFSIFYQEFLELFYFWLEYFKSNKIEGIATSHTVYSYGLPLRIAINFGIPSYVFSSTNVIKLNKKNIFGGLYGDYKNYHKKFLNLDKNLKNKGLKISKKILKEKFDGKLTNSYYESKSSFGKISKKKFLKNNKKTKILICTHDFFDAAHIYGEGIFSDFYEWLEFLFEISKETKYDWYIKNHPDYLGKFRLTQPISNSIVTNLLKSNKHIKLLPNNLSNKQIVNEGIDVVLTVYGTVASEFPYFFVPVINASPNPHTGYNFSISPKNLKQYKKLILNLHKIKFRKKNKQELYEYYFMSRILNYRNWLTGNYDDLLKSVGGYSNLQSNYFYKFWIKYFNYKKKDILLNKIDEFLSSKKERLEIKNL